MRTCLYTNTKDMRRLCLAAFILWQCAISTCHAFHHPAMRLTSLPHFMTNGCHPQHPLVTSLIHPTQTHRSWTIPMTLTAWNSNNGDSSDPVSAASSFQLLIAAITTTSQTEAWVQPLSNVLDPFLNFMSFAMVRTCTVPY